MTCNKGHTSIPNPEKKTKNKNPKRPIWRRGVWKTAVSGPQPDPISPSWHSKDLHLCRVRSSWFSPFGTSCFFWGKEYLYQLPPETVALFGGLFIAQSPPQQNQKQVVSIYLSWWLQSFYSLYPAAVSWKPKSFFRDWTTREYFRLDFYSLWQ